MTRADEQITGRRREELKVFETPWPVRRIVHAVDILFILILFFFVLFLESPSTLAPSARDLHGSCVPLEAALSLYPCVFSDSGRDVNHSGNTSATSRRKLFVW